MAEKVKATPQVKEYMERVTGRDQSGVDFYERNAHGGFDAVDVDRRETRSYRTDGYSYRLNDRMPHGGEKSQHDMSSGRVSSASRTLFDEDDRYPRAYKSYFGDTKYEGESPVYYPTLGSRRAEGDDDDDDDRKSSARASAAHFAGAARVPEALAEMTAFHADVVSDLAAGTSYEDFGFDETCAEDASETELAVYEAWDAVDEAARTVCEEQPRSAACASLADTVAAAESLSQDFALLLAEEVTPDASFTAESELVLQAQFYHGGAQQIGEAYAAWKKSQARKPAQSATTARGIYSTTSSIYSTTSSTAVRFRT